jgi:hypothetical protein
VFLPLVGFQIGIDMLVHETLDAVDPVSGLFAVFEIH